jgi:hypothetical protein
MRPTSAVLAFGLLVTPFAAQAEAIPQSVLGDYRASCTSSCEQTKTEDQCAAICGCVTDKMADEWTMAKYEEVSQLHAVDPNDATVKSTMDGMVAQCRQTVQTGG